MDPLSCSLDQLMKLNREKDKKNQQKNYQSSTSFAGGNRSSARGGFRGRGRGRGGHPSNYYNISGSHNSGGGNDSSHNNGFKNEWRKVRKQKTRNLLGGRQRGQYNKGQSYQSQYTQQQSGYNGPQQTNPQTKQQQQKEPLQRKGIGRQKNSKDGKASGTVRRGGLGIRGRKAAKSKIRIPSANTNSSTSVRNTTIYKGGLSRRRDQLELQERKSAPINGGKGSSNCSRDMTSLMSQINAPLSSLTSVLSTSSKNTLASSSGSRTAPKKRLAVARKVNTTASALSQKARKASSASPMITKATGGKGKSVGIREKKAVLKATAKKSAALNTSFNRTRSTISLKGGGKSSVNRLPSQTRSASVSKGAAASSATVGKASPKIARAGTVNAKIGKGIASVEGARGGVEKGAISQKKQPQTQQYFQISGKVVRGGRGARAGLGGRGRNTTSARGGGVLKPLGFGQSKMAKLKVNPSSHQIKLNQLKMTRANAKATSAGGIGYGGMSGVDVPYLTNTSPLPHQSVFGSFVSPYATNLGPGMSSFPYQQQQYQQLYAQQRPLTQAALAQAPDLAHVGAVYTGSPSLLSQQSQYAQQVTPSSQSQQHLFLSGSEGVSSLDAPADHQTRQNQFSTSSPFTASSTTSATQITTSALDREAMSKIRIMASLDKVPPPMEAQKRHETTLPKHLLQTSYSPSSNARSSRSKSFTNLNDRFSA